MGIFLIENKIGLYKTMRPCEDISQRLLVDNYGNSLLSSWKEVSFKWNTEDGEIARDSFLYMGYILVISEKTKQCLNGILDSNSAELLPIDIEEEQYYVVNVLKRLSGVVDLKRSDVSYFKDKNIKWISKFVFRPDITIYPIFNVSEVVAPIFADSQFVDAINGNKLIGLTFKKCKISSKSIFSLIFKK